MPELLRLGQLLLFNLKKEECYIAGSTIHALADEQDLRKMGGLTRY
jgi:hypothetical protein